LHKIVKPVVPTFPAPLVPKIKRNFVHNIDWEAGNDANVQEAQHYAPAGSKNSYKSCIRKFNNFCEWLNSHGVRNNGGVRNEDTVKKFVTALAKNGYALKTIKVHIAAINDQRADLNLDSLYSSDHHMFNKFFNNVQKMMATTDPTNGEGAIPFKEYQIFEILWLLKETASDTLKKMDLILGFTADFRADERIKMTINQIQFTEDGWMKIFRGKRKNDQKALDCEWIPVAPNTLYPDICPVRITRHYLSMLPPVPPDSRFLKLPNKTDSKYTKRNVGKNTLYDLVKQCSRLVHDIQFPELYTPNSYRKSAATIAVDKGIPKHQIMALTGHKTETAFNQYVDKKYFDMKQAAVALLPNNDPEKTGILLPENLEESKLDINCLEIMSDIDTDVEMLQEEVLDIFNEIEKKVFSINFVVDKI